MKFFFLVCLFVSVSAFGQTNSDFPFCTDKLRRMTYFQLVRAVEMDTQRERIEKLQIELENAKKMGIITASEIDRMKEENKQLEQEMKALIQQIDKQNSQNAELSGELDKEEK